MLQVIRRERERCMADILYSWKEETYSHEQNGALQMPIRSKAKSFLIKALIVFFFGSVGSRDYFLRINFACTFEC